MTLSVGARLGPYDVLSFLGAGGFGEVYQARDTRLDRTVAIKILTSTDPELRTRFTREAKAIAALTHPHICTLYDVGHDGGTDYLVMEFLEGETLAARLSRGPLTLTAALPVAMQIAEALDKAHRSGIVHRDLKPGNVMVHADGTTKVLDFGLARLARPGAEFSGEATTRQRQTVPGTIMGTPHYMSPEQMRGETADAASDLWSLGVLLYESLAGRRPFDGGSPAETLSAILTREPTPLWSLNRDVPSGLARLVTSLLTKERQRRPSAAAVARELKQLAEGVAARPARARRRKVLAAAAVVVLGLVAAGGWWAYRASKRQWARYEAIPQARTLADSGDYTGAYRLALGAAQYIPREEALLHLWPGVSQLLSVRTDPAGAEVMWRPYAQMNAPWETLGRTPVENARIPGGAVRVQVAMGGYEPVQVAVDRVASVGATPDSTYDFTLSPSGSPRARMVSVAATPAASTLFGARQSMEPFEIDRYEVTNREFRTFVDAGGYRRREYWTVALVQNGRRRSWEEAMAQFVDPTGRPGPGTWEAGSYPPGHDDYPVSGVSWYEAAAYAAFVGKSLPTIDHWVRASNFQAVATDLRFLVGLSNLAAAHPRRVGASGAVNTMGLYDVVGNVREWAWNEIGARRYVLGGSWTDKAEGTLAAWDNLDPFDRSIVNGFRCVRYADPVGALQRFGGPRSPERFPDYYKIKPVSDEVFDVYKRLYAYDRKPLNPVVESVAEAPALWRREKIRFKAPYGNEEVIAYLFLPKDGRPPYQSVVYMADGGTLRRGSGETIEPEQFILRSGRAILYPIYKGTLDRYVSMPPGPLALRDLTITWGKDLGSSVDYLETRADIDATRLAYMGHSMGTRFAPMMLAMERRFKTAVLLAGAMRPVGALPEVDPVNFLPRVTIPILHVTGQYDAGYPVAVAQKPFFDLFGTPPQDKRHVVLPVGHAILVPEVRTTVIREVLDWLDRYLGKP